MEIRNMTKADLLAKIDALNLQIKQLNASAAECSKTDSESLQSEQRIPHICSSVPIGLVISNLQGDILSANQAILDLLGFSPDEAKTMNIIDFYTHQEDRLRLLDLLKEENRVFDFRTTINKKNGGTIMVLLNADFIDFDNGKALLTSILDIGWFEKNQAELRKSESEYRLLFSNAPIGITVTDVKGELIASNQAIHELLGYNTDELKNINVNDFYSNASERHHLMKIMEKTGFVRDFEARFKHRNGSLITVLINADLIDYKGHHQALLTSIRSITNLKQVESELTKERDFISAILDITASLVMVINREGMLTRCNRACELLSGYTFSELESKPIWEIFPNDVQLTKDRFGKAIEGQYPINHEAIWRTKNGDNRLISWTNTVMLNEADRINYIIATGIDITHQRRSEIELQKANLRLLSWVDELEERTAELNQMSEMGDQLQGCETVIEACAIGAQYIQQIFPGSNGSIYLINASKKLAESVEMWGNLSLMEHSFVPTDCWAIRRSKAHIIDETHTGLRCEHVIGPKHGEYLCFPMMANGETIGIFYLNFIMTMKHEQSETTTKSYSENKMQLAITVAEHLTLSLLNIRLRETLRHQSMHDVLTGLYNRRYMQSSLERELARAKYDNKPIGMIMFDVDHFKEFNDVSGHDAGDALLRELGELLKNAVREGDIASRYGGDEFVIILPGANLEVTKLRAEKLRERVKKLSVLHRSKPLGACSISVGVAAFPVHGTTGEELLKNADLALYDAKNQGRDRVATASLSKKNGK